MIDDEADFGSIFDAPVEGLAKFRPKLRAKPRKTPSKALGTNSNVAASVEKVGAFNVDIVSQNTKDDNHKYGRNDYPSQDLRDQESVAVSDTQASLRHPDSKMIDNLADFGSILDAPVQEQTVAKFQPKLQAKPSKAASKAPGTNPNVAEAAAKAGASTVDTVFQDKKDDNHEKGRNDNPSQETRDQESMAVSDTQALSDADATVGLDSLDELISPSPDASAVGKFKPKSNIKPKNKKIAKPSSTDSEAVASVTNLETSAGASEVEAILPQPHEAKQPDRQNSEVLDHEIGTKAVFSVESREDNPLQISEPSEPMNRTDFSQHESEASVHESDDQLLMALSNMDSIDELSFHNSAISVEATIKFQPKIRRKKGQGESIYSVLPDASEVVAPTDVNSEMSNLTERNHYSEQIMTDENLNDLSQLSATKVTLSGNSSLKLEEHCITKEQHSNDREDAGKDSQYQYDGEPVDHVVEERPSSDIGEKGSSMKLRSRKKTQKVGIPEHSVDDNLDDEDYIGPSVDELENGSGDEYMGEGNQKKVRKKSKEKDVSKGPSRGRKRTSKDSSIEESPQKKLHKDESKASSRGRKRTSKDSSIEQPEKKQLTHRIRRKRIQVVESLLKMPEHEIDRKKLSMKVLRLYQEATEHTKGEEKASGPSSSNQSCRPREWDAFDFSEEREHYDDEETNNNISQNATKLNYHSYMNKSTQVRWSKSDTDLFYQAIRQFGTDFAMIQQLFPNRTRRQVSQKFKSEEKKHPMQIHDALIHRSTDNSYFRRVIEQLNIQGVQLDIGATQNLEGASNDGAPENENAVGDFTNEEEEDDLNWLHKEESPNTVKQGEQISADTDDLDDVFDWY